jgi:hypothetical protein
MERTPKQRTLLAQALLIATDKSPIAPTFEHIRALLAVGADCREFSAAMARVQQYEEYTRRNNIAVITNGLSHEELSTVTTV